MNQQRYGGKIEFPLVDTLEYEPTPRKGPVFGSLCVSISPFLKPVAAVFCILFLICCRPPALLPFPFLVL